jgi:hypothetical protein
MLKYHKMGLASGAGHAPATAQACATFSARPHGLIPARSLVTVDLNPTDEHTLRGNKTGA